ncbi:uncharacterized protein LOC111707668 isoform X2 [Eurytemora carolleeae]|uniref:uncharacterized protein LOC111707668 isoform X2 n=1 Tax=Eurytemora carolleeae TaxID=1294199 RepID=UPI000C76238C|nr:uncharacterized protein LOC111707668 isoform X2 [Eurytemora carolleeae]|eukprot:XP_023336577.1 uncharacterized protein LOC111707668 isoform X2 [Eurytemora affinis]
MCSDRYFLGIIATVSLGCSLAYLFLFSIPHSSWIPVSPGWQEISLNIVVAASNNLTWTPEDDRYLLLNSFASALGALGFNRDKVYNQLFNSWAVLLTFTSVFNLINVIACILIYFYVFKFYQPRYRFLLLPWIILACLVFMFLGAVLVIMLYYLSDRARIIAEIRETKLNYYKAVTLLIIFATVHYASFLLSVLHYLEAEEKAAYIWNINRQGSEWNISMDSRDQPQTPPPGYTETIEEGLHLNRIHIYDQGFSHISKPIHLNPVPGHNQNFKQETVTVNPQLHRGGIQQVHPEIHQAWIHQRAYEERQEVRQQSALEVRQEEIQQRNPELHQEGIKQRDPEVHQEGIKQRDPEVHQEGIQQRYPKLHQEGNQQRDPKLHQEGIQQRYPELHQEGIQQKYPELHQEEIQQRDPEVRQEWTVQKDSEVHQKGIQPKVSELHHLGIQQRYLELHQEGIQKKDPEVRQEWIQQRGSDAHQEGIPQRDPELHQEGIQQRDPELHKEGIKQRDPELHQERIQQRDTELHQEGIQPRVSELHQEGIHKRESELYQEGDNLSNTSKITIIPNLETFSINHQPYGQRNIRNLQADLCSSNSDVDKSNL